MNLIPILSSTGNCPKSHYIPHISELIKLQLMMTYIQKYFPHLDIFKIATSHLRYISYCQKEAFFEDKYDQKKELQNGKDSLVFRVRVIKK